MLKKILWVSLPLILLLGPIILGLALNVDVRIKDFSLGLYFIMLLVYLTLQYTFAVFNRIRVNNLPRGDYTQKVSILVVGYKENPEYFEYCIKSINNLTYTNIVTIVFVSDDDTSESDYMHNTFKDVLKGKNIRSLRIEHRGKRHAMDRGFREIQFDKSRFICTIDSDTILQSDCIERLMDLMTSDPAFGAVTGHLCIFNDSSVISFVSRLRYFFAFNIERAAQSLFGVVNCISGPLGLYKKEVIQESRLEWLNQTFLKQECSYGDDRHLTYQALKRGYKVGYTHLAEAETETPEKISRWFHQQTRWNKSSIRETKWTFKTIEQHNIWMTIEMVYILCYHFIVLASLGYIIFFTNAFYLSTWFLVTFGLTFVKGVIACIMERDPLYLLFPVYNLLFTFCFIPSKIYGLCTLKDTSWGTTTRKLVTSDSIFSIYPIFLWVLLILSGVVYNCVILTEWTSFNIIYSSVTLGLYVLFVVLAKIKATFFTKGLGFVKIKYGLV